MLPCARACRRLRGSAHVQRGPSANRESRVAFSSEALAIWEYLDWGIDIGLMALAPAVDEVAVVRAATWRLQNEENTPPSSQRHTCVRLLIGAVNERATTTQRPRESLLVFTAREVRVTAQKRHVRQRQ